MTSELITCLSKQADHERLASACYVALSNWCEDYDFTGYSAFFNQQAAEELEHMEKIHRHLLDRDVCPEMGPLDAPTCSFDGLSVVAREALALEEANSAGVRACYEAAMAENDYPAKLLMEWFITEQVEEEEWARKMVTLTERAACSGGLLYLDRHINKYLSE